MSYFDDNVSRYAGYL